MKLLEETIKNIKPVGIDLIGKTQQRIDNLTKPQGSLGRIEELAKRFVVITGNENPEILRKVIFTLAADHGVTDEGISLFPKEVTAQMVYNFINGGAGINVLARHCRTEVIVVDMGVAQDFSNVKGLVTKKIKYGTANIAKGPAMKRRDAVKSIEEGIKLVERELEKRLDIVGVGDMGIGNTTVSSAILAVLSGEEIRNTVGKGTGIDDSTVEKKIKVISKAIEINKPDTRDAIDVLSKIGGFEIGGIAGIILACARHRIPVVLDGFISGAGALIAKELKPEVADYLIASHLSAERGHGVMLKTLGIVPLFDLSMRLGEGTGAALGINLVEASVKVLTEMATFDKAGVSGALKT